MPCIQLPHHDFVRLTGVVDARFGMWHAIYNAAKARRHNVPQAVRYAMFVCEPLGVAQFAASFTLHE